MDESITREQLSAYLDDALSEMELARVEKALRQSEKLREMLAEVRDEQDRGEHSLGAIWRRERLSCPTREQLTQYLHGLLAEGYQSYVDFHLNIIACPYCLANFDDLKEKQIEIPPQTKQRRKKIYDSSVGKIEELENG